jgi:hypothetical protein
MYIANYKSVQTSEEFYSEKRDSLDFPTQVELSGQRYLLRATYLAGSLSQENNIIETAKRYDIRYNIKIS